MTTTHEIETERGNILSALADEAFDLLVVGGGITGAGVARDAALRGLRVALVEAEDYASGTSSRSSRLIHGGVRYLEHGQLGLVFESSRERRTLQRIAPHLVRPLAFTWPVYRGARVPRWKLGAGLMLYDALSLFRNVERHDRLSREEVVAHEPALRDDALLGGARYWDAGTDDARLTLATVMSARHAGAVALNHARVTGFLREGTRIAGATVDDAIDGGQVDVRARLVVNATGPWSDQIERLVRPGAAAGVRGSKGVHVSVPRDRVGNHSAVTLTAPQDGRVMFVLPSGAHTIIGTTDTFDDVAPEEVRATTRDVQYLLDAANHYFPHAELTVDDVTSAWAGLRPLAAKGAGRGAPGSASREHSITESAPGLIRVTGGKLTTYRAMAEEIVDVAERALGRTPTPSLTAMQPLPGGDLTDLTEEISHAIAATGDDLVGRRLACAHGTGWPGIWSLLEADGRLGGLVNADLPYMFAELLHATTHEQAATLGDLLIRRTPIAFETHDHGRAAARRLAPIMGRWLQWSSAQAADAVAAYEAESDRIFTIDED